MVVSKISLSLLKVKVNVNTLVRPVMTIRMIIIIMMIHKTTLFQRFMSNWNVAAVVEIRIEFHM
jgi:hypothetical protein